ncbi:AAA family ATPase [Dokdonella soli]|uniref:AAA family ATPase n=1 Tax=Dokdonella soli TaxID=529810 RepID=A0ABN1IFJ9_9GAMM
MDALPYLRQISFRREDVSNPALYPFSLPAIAGLTSLTFHPAVTFFVGENGSGKSTLLEALAVVLGINPEGGNRNTRFNTEATHSDLWRHLKPVKSFKRPREWYFLRAESFYNVASYMDGLMPPEVQGYGGVSLHRQSHGESFMAVLANKLHGQGLYILDEPEAALSPTRQMSALVEIHRLVQAQSQFIIATHSPILMSYPNAKIMRIDAGGIEEVAYVDTEHYNVTRDFLNRHERMLSELLTD